METGPRQRLISSAVALLSTEGVEAVTLRRIARAAGVSHGAPLRHFTGRAELLSAVATEGFAELRKRGEDLPEDTAQERLLAASLWAALHGLAELRLYGGLADVDTTLEVTLSAYLGSGLPT